jgi:cytochrome c-type biogenesis protein CcsB
MFELSHYAFLAALAATGLAFCMAVVGALSGRRQLVLAGAGAEVETSGTTANWGRYGSILAVNAFVFLTASLVLRGIAAGHAPFSNMYEFSLAFAWCALALGIFFERRYQFKTLALLVLPIALGLQVYATTVSDTIEPLVPALRNNLLLTVHVAMAILAYGAFTVAFAAGVLYMVQRKNGVKWLPKNSVLDEVGYKAVMVGFPMLALAILLGAVWAEIAWGTYWSWDPKETASLATWLIYGGYLHARVVRGWRGERSAWLLIGGFGAILFTYYGNLFLGGMHTYAG